jgi:hypothetical protein
MQLTGINEITCALQWNRVHKVCQFTELVKPLEYDVQEKKSTTFTEKNVINSYWLVNNR